MNRLIYMTVCWVVLLAHTQTSKALADIFYATGAAANIGNSPWGGDGSSALGSGSSASFSFSGLQDVVNATSNAGAGPYTANGVLKLSAESQSFSAGPNSLVSSLAIATYSDRILANNNYGQSIALSFVITGTAQLKTSGGVSYGAAAMDMSWAPGFAPASSLLGVSGIGLPPGSSASVVLNLDGISQNGLNGFQAGSNGIGTSFSGRFTVEASFDQSTNSYGFYLANRVTSSAYNAIARMNVGNTVTLVGASDSTGQNIELSSLAFASGASFTAVPEPSSSLLIGTCVVFSLRIAKRFSRKR